MELISTKRVLWPNFQALTIRGYCARGEPVAGTGLRPRASLLPGELPKRLKSNLGDTDYSEFLKLCRQLKCI